MNGDQNPSGGPDDRVRKLVASIVVGTLIFVFATAWVGLSVSGVFQSIPTWVSYAIAGAGLVILIVVWRFLTRRVK